MDISLSEKRRLAGRKGGLKGGRARVKKGFAAKPIGEIRLAQQKGTQTKHRRKKENIEPEQV